MNEMTDAERTAHLREHLRGDFAAHLREEHGVETPPVKRAEAASLHAKLHAPTTDAASSRDASVLAGVTRTPEPAKATDEPKARATRTRKAPVAPATPAKAEETPKPATRTRSRKATAPAAAEDATPKPPARRTRKLVAVPDVPEETPKPARATRTRKAPAATETAPKPATRSRKAPATPEPAKPATRTRTRREPAPAPSVSDNGSGELSRSERKRALAREVVTLVTERFADLSDAEKADIAYWLHWCPTGNLWWPSNGFPEPVTDGWTRGKARLAEAAKAKAGK